MLNDTNRTPQEVRIDVVIVTYNSEPVLRGCFESLGTSPNISVFVVDNGSVDNSVEIAKSAGTAVTVLEDNPGFGAACNAGARLGDGEVICFVNPDVRADAATIKSCARQMLAERAAVAGCRLIQADGSLDHACKRMIISPIEALKHLAGRSRATTYHAPHVSEIECGTVDAVNGAFLMIGRGLFNQVKGFDESYWMYGEDLDLCVRAAAEQGTPVRYYGTLTATHLKSAGTGRSRSPKLNYHFYRSAWRFYWIHQRRNNSAIGQALIFLGLCGWGTLATIRDLVRRLRGNGLPIKILSE